MKTFFKTSYLIVIFCFSAIIYSCTNDFLEEEQITALDTDYFTTQDGLDDLITGIYQSLKFHFNYEWAYTTTNYGVDEFTVGGDKTYSMWNNYGASLNSETEYVADVWDNMYGNINSCNIAIQNIPLYYDSESETYNTRLGEAYFMRGFDYFKLVKQYGGVVIKQTPSTCVELEFTRSPEKETYAQVLSDLLKAYSLLPETPENTGRITKWAAAHFLSKAYLFRASELYDDWNSDTKDTDLDSVIFYADEVINSGYHNLADDYADLWNFTEVDGTNETLDEIILSAQFSDNTSTIGRYGNQVHLYYPSVYITLAGMSRDIAGGREFQRLRTTDYAMDVYDRINDSRFWKSFKTRYLCNNPDGAPVWGKYAPDGTDSADVKFAGGEDAILYIVNDAGDDRYTEESINYRAPHMFVRYFEGESENLIMEHGNYTVSRYVTLSKFLDGSRSSVASQFGHRDGILARLAETYLLAAEAYGRKEEYAAALPYINAVRDRAAYTEGEDRSSHVDGGAAWENNAVANTADYVSYSDKNTYFESNNMDTTTASTLDEMHLNSVSDIYNAENEFYDELNVSSNADKFLHFILNERSRELMGELLRWEDLARTKTLVLRSNTFNEDADPDDPTHYLRPIPQDFLDAIQSNGSALTADEKEDMQNPGY